jgi:hydrogenase maturation protein HypF
MLPYTPLHHLLFQNSTFPALVMTSGNRSGDPIVRENNEALTRLGSLADYFLFHDRDILVRNDDSVLLLHDTAPVLLRRSRSFVPSPIRLAMDCGRTLALGGLIKNTVCLTRGHEALLSQHLGDLDQPETLGHQQRAIDRLLDLLAITPDLMVHDLHPDNPGMRYARQRPGCPSVGVQHHHAHVVSCMVEHNLHGPVIGVALDGTGYGPDNTIWGGEILIATHGGYSRAAHLDPVHLPGGEAAIRQPWRMAISHLYHSFGSDFEKIDLPLLHHHRQELSILRQMMDQQINAPLTSSCGRLFDAIAVLAGLRQQVTFEGQVAMELESLAAADATPGPASVCYGLEIEESNEKPWIMRTAPIIRGVVDDLRQGVPGPAIASRFHITLARLLATTCQRLGRREQIDQVVLSGGVFQNLSLLRLLVPLLENYGCTVYTHSLVPPNDGGLALGQAVAGRAMHEGKTGVVIKTAEGTQ